MEKQKSDSKYIKNIVLYLSTLFGLGFVPKLSGTAGSLAACVFFFILPSSFGLYLVVLLSLIILSFMVCGISERIMGVKDPKPVIIDDFTGMFLSLFFASKQVIEILLCFILFRIFDGLKVFPSNLIEKKQGSLAILGDDLVAGGYALVVFYSGKYLANMFL